MAELLDLFRAGDVEDQGIVLRPSLGLKNLQNRLFIQSVGSQTIDRLRGDGYQASGSDNIGRDGRGIRVCGG